MDYKKSSLILNAGTIVGILMAIFGLTQRMTTLGYVGVGVWIICYVQAMIFYKCPSCGVHFNINARKPRYCPNCNRELD